MSSDAASTVRARMIVTRVKTEDGSHLQPQMDENWPERMKLDWWAAATAYDTGLDVRVAETTVEFNDRPLPGPHYCVIVGSISAGSFNYRGAWTYLSGVSAGARAVSELTWAPQRWITEVQP